LSTKDPSLTAGLTEIKTILTSIQGSLITSVSLIQGTYIFLVYFNVVSFHKVCNVWPQWYLYFYVALKSPFYVTHLLGVKRQVSLAKKLFLIA
jgi:hypothetical protein